MVQSGLKSVPQEFLYSAFDTTVECTIINTAIDESAANKVGDIAYCGPPARWCFLALISLFCLHTGC